MYHAILFPSPNHSIQAIQSRFAELAASPSIKRAAATIMMYIFVYSFLDKYNTKPKKGYKVRIPAEKWVRVRL